MQHQCRPLEHRTASQPPALHPSSQPNNQALPRPAHLARLADAGRKEGCDAIGGAATHQAAFRQARPCCCLGCNRSHGGAGGYHHQRQQVRKGLNTGGTRLGAVWAAVIEGAMAAGSHTPGWAFYATQQNQPKPRGSSTSSTHRPGLPAMQGRPPLLDRSQASVRCCSRSPATGHAATPQPSLHGRQAGGQTGGQAVGRPGG